MPNKAQLSPAPDLTDTKLVGLSISAIPEVNRHRFIFTDRHCELVMAHRRSQRPSEYGTVAEISTRTGLSKSEIRRHKAAGTLTELLDKLSYPTS